MEQWGIVGVNSTRTCGREPWVTVIWGADTTASCSNDSGCSGSEIERMRSVVVQRGGGVVSGWISEVGQHRLPVVPTIGAQGVHPAL